jgi:hypothetical protein
VIEGFSPLTAAPLFRRAVDDCDALRQPLFAAAAHELAALAVQFQLVDEPLRHRRAKLFAVADAVLHELHVAVVGQQVERAGRQVRHGVACGRRLVAEIAPLPDLGGERVGVAE